MTRASAFFSADEVARIERAVADAETRTSGEIVPVVAAVSGRYDRAEDLFGLVFAAALLSLVWLLFQGVETPPWGGGLQVSLGLIPILIVVFGGFLSGAVLASFVPVLRLPFISRTEMAAEVDRSAAAAFHRCRVRATAGACGVLIYVSLYERMVRVLGDDAISARLSPSDWEQVCDLAVTGLREGDGAGGLVRAIEKAGELLAQHFPRGAADVDELPNQLVFID